MKQHSQRRHSSFHPRSSRYEDAINNEAESSVFMSLGIAETAPTTDLSPRRRNRQSRDEKKATQHEDEEFVDFLFKSLDVEPQKKTKSVKVPGSPLRRLSRVFGARKQAA